MQTRPMQTATTDYVWFNGRTMPQATCDTYNAVSATIASRKAAGMNTEALRNGRHNLVNSWVLSCLPRSA